AAVEWYTRAAEAGNADGQYALAFLYQDGRGVAQDLERAHVLWETATLQGHEGARHELCERSGRFCHTCVADPSTLKIRQLRGNDPMSFLEGQELMSAAWALDDEIIINGKTFSKSGLPQVRTFDVLEFFAFKDK